MGNVDDHPLVFHPPHDVAPERGQPALLYPVHRSRHFVVEEVGQAGHAEARIVQLVEVFGLAFKVLQPLDRE